MNDFFDSDKLAQDKKAQILYELSYTYFDEIDIKTIEGYIDEIVKLKLNNNDRINMKFKIGTNILSRIDKRRSVEYIDDIIKEYGYESLNEIEFFCEDVWETNIMFLLDIYVQAYSIQYAKEVYKKLRENNCCKRSKPAEEYLREVENELVKEIFIIPK